MNAPTSTELRRLVRFTIVGCSNAIVGYVVFMAFFQSQLLSASIRTPISQLASYVVGVSWAFIWNRAWVFGKRKSGRFGVISQTIRFMLIQAFCLILSVISVTLAIDLLDWPATLGWIAAMSLVTVVNYLAISSWVFPSPSKENG